MVWGRGRAIGRRGTAAVRRWTAAARRQHGDGCHDSQGGRAPRAPVTTGLAVHHGAALIALSASVTELGEQSLTDTLTCGAAPDRSWVIAATPVADSVPSGPAWPRAKMLAPTRSWPGLAWGMTTSVSPEVVTGIRVPVDVTRVKPAALASDTLPWTRTKAAGVPALLGCPTVTMAAAIVPSELAPRTTTDAPSVMSLSSGPDTLTNVDGVVVTVTG